MRSAGGLLVCHSACWWFSRRERRFGFGVVFLLLLLFERVRLGGEFVSLLCLGEEESCDINLMLYTIGVRLEAYSLFFVGGFDWNCEVFF